MEKGQVYKSRSCGDFELIEKVEGSRFTRWKVRFLNTGYESEAYTNNIRQGRVLDASIKNALGRYKVGQVITDKFGKQIEILDIEKKKRNDGYRNRTILKIKFLPSGYITSISADATIRKNVIVAKDYYSPTVKGVGILGNIDHILKQHGRIRDSREYRLWEGILDRCYQKSYEFKNKSYEKAEICERWKRFEYFYEDLPKVEGYDLRKKYREKYPNKKNVYEFDKDTKVLGNKIYSPETVRFLHKNINAGFTLHAKENTKIELLQRLESVNIV